MWIGRQIGPRWGVVGRFWNLDQNSAFAPRDLVDPLTNFATFSETSRTSMHLIDVEGIRSFDPGRLKLDATLGARQASFSNQDAVSAFGVFTTGNFVNLNLSNGFHFEGVGTTGSLTARRSLGDSLANLFFTIRGSDLYGQSDSFGRAAGAVASSPSAPLVGAATVTRNNAKAALTIYEFQAGALWDVPLEIIEANAFFRTSFEYQNWAFHGKPTGGAGFGGTIGTLTTNSFASAGLGDVDLYGVSIATGVTW